MATIPRLKKARHWKAFVSEKDTAKATEIIIKQTALRYVRLKFSSEDLKKTTQEQLDKWIKGTEKYFEVSRPRIEKYLENCCSAAGMAKTLDDFIGARGETDILARAVQYREVVDFLAGSLRQLGRKEEDNCRLEKADRWSREVSDPLIAKLCAGLKAKEELEKGSEPGSSGCPSVERGSRESVSTSNGHQSAASITSPSDGPPTIQSDTQAASMAPSSQAAPFEQKMSELDQRMQEALSICQSITSGTRNQPSAADANPDTGAASSAL